MHIFIQAIYYDLWGVIVNGPLTSTILVDGVASSKPKKGWNDLDKKMAQLNAKAMNTLYYFLNANKFNRKSTCNSTKKICDRLKIIYEGTN